ncbi:17978_t:CDS:2 [Funneliformis caledonium]|uniref:17978_t:CDS:1 n=1 Tax=Funneliformis caledonium TaxID=1117310 RepID=A0A9N9EYW1_9GLOM|nr:17978_t:CDS:2 [Funneliformis caledonium]
MSSNNFEGEMLQSEDPEEALSPKANSSKRSRQRIQKPLKWQRLTPHNSAEPCGHFLGSDNSTGNFIVHLTTHQITEESHERKMNEIRNNNQVSQPRIDETIQDNPNIKSNRDRKFVRILIKDNRPISICNDEGFIEFIHKFDPNYQPSSDKTVQQLLAEAYNIIKSKLF